MHLVTEKGDTVFFHSLLIRGSGRIRGLGFWKAVFCHYASASYHYIDVKGNSQEGIKKEMRNAVEKFSLTADGTNLKNIWKFRPQHVKGGECPEALQGSGLWFSRHLCCASLRPFTAQEARRGGQL